MRSKITNKLVALFLLATACGGRQVEGTDGNTHWLQCQDDSDCTSYSCLDGYCRPESALSYTPGESTVPDDADTPEPDNQEDASDEGPTLLSYASDVPGAQGAACIPSEEYSPQFSGFSAKEVAFSPNDQCDSNLCLVNKFQGRVTCPYGQGGSSDGECLTADGASTVDVGVSPHLVERRPENSVYCSCRCDGPDPMADCCECGEGFECAELASAGVPGQQDKVGSYCVVADTNPDYEAISAIPCGVYDQYPCEGSEHYTPGALGVSPSVPAASESVNVIFDLVL